MCTCTITGIDCVHHYQTSLILYGCVLCTITGIDCVHHYQTSLILYGCVLVPLLVLTVYITTKHLLFCMGVCFVPLLVLTVFITTKHLLYCMDVCLYHYWYRLCSSLLNISHIVWMCTCTITGIDCVHHYRTSLILYGCVLVPLLVLTVFITTKHLLFCMDVYLYHYWY